MRRAALAAVAALLVAALCGCATPDEQLTDAASAGVSAVRSSALALELEADGRAWRPASDTVLVDALSELDDAHRSTLELVPENDQEQEHRDRLADELQHALRTVAGARVALARGAQLEAWITELDASADALEATSS